MIAVAFGCAARERPLFEIGNVLGLTPGPIPLNRSIVLQFRGGLVDPASIHGGGIVIEEESGRSRGLVPGRFEVTNDNRVAFHPRLASMANLSDGGLLPGRRYRIVVRGFPSAAGVRSTTGQVLSRSMAVSFVTAASGRELFEDFNAGVRPVMTTDHPVDFDGVGPAEVHIESGTRLVLQMNKPARPDGIRKENFIVRTGVRGEFTIPLELRLFNDAIPPRIELEAKTPLDPGTSALVELSPNITDLGGAPFQGPLTPRFVWVAESRAFVPAVLIQEFLGMPDPSAAGSGSPSPAQTAGAAAATAAWAGDGRATVHFPAIAASAPDGIVHFAPDQVLPVRVASLSMSFPPGSQFKAVSGTVLSSQKNLNMDSMIKLQKDGAPVPQTDGVPPGFDLAIIAAGNLSVGGAIQGSGTVLLAAGGTVTITREARLKVKSLRIVAPAGFTILGDVPAEREVTRTPLADAQSIASPESLIYEITSPWQRAGTGMFSVGNVDWVGDPGAAKISILLRSARALPNSGALVDPTTVSNWTDRLEDVPAGDRLQFKLQFEIPPQAPGRPFRIPFVDRVSITTRRQDPGMEKPR